MKESAFHLDWTAKCLRGLSPGPWADRLPRAWRNAFIILAVSATLIGSGCAVFLCFRSSGALSTVGWLPDAVGQWADRHGRLRNLPAFFLLACPILLVLRPPQSRLWAMAAVGVFGTGLELAEYFIPGRQVEWQDIAWTWAGALAAWLVVESIGWVSERAGAGRWSQQRS